MEEYGIEKVAGMWNSIKDFFGKVVLGEKYYVKPVQEAIGKSINTTNKRVADTKGILEQLRQQIAKYNEIAHSYFSKPRAERSAAVFQKDTVARDAKAYFEELAKDKKALTDLPFMSDAASKNSDSLRYAARRFLGKNDIAKEVRNARIAAGAGGGAILGAGGLTALALKKKKD